MMSSLPGSGLVAYSRPLPNVTPYDFLRAFPEDVRVFWQRGQYSTAYAGVGAAYMVSGNGDGRFETLRQQIEVLCTTMLHDSTAGIDVRPRFFGGAAFEPGGAADALWSPFGDALMILPRFVLTRAGGYCWLTVCHVGAGDAHARLDTLKQAAKEVAVRLENTLFGAASSSAVQLTELVSQEDWGQMIRCGVDMIHRGELRKIVLSRSLDAGMNRPVDAVAAVAALEKSYPTAFRFLFEPQVGTTFFGATPELLARLDGGSLHTHALAGSAPRSSKPDEDDRIAADLLASSKDRHEHALVVEWLRETLAPLSRTLEVPDTPVVTKLKNIQHLFTPVQAQLRDKTHLLQVIERLHPTPALGGDPQQMAREAIQRIERMPRGWYGAPVGWIDAYGEGEFAVAIRSGLAYDSSVRLFAGAGIVADSDPDREWDETAIKFKPMLGALAVEYDGRISQAQRVDHALEGVAS